LSRWHYLPVGIGLLGGQLLTLGPVSASRTGVPGWLQTLAGWIAALRCCSTCCVATRAANWHARSAACALLFGSRAWRW
jgi:uncharacterized protein involved in response to NO